MKANTKPLQPNTYYHIYNKGINGTPIFTKEKHYQLFLDKYSYHVAPFVDTYAYCLMSNHFHKLIRVKSEKEIEEITKLRYKNKKIDNLQKFLSSQFAHLFNGYTQAFNKDVQRTGGLFESPFRRIEINSGAYFSQLVWYIHFNPQKHGFVTDFRDYPHSSYWSHLQNKNTKLCREEVLDWFGNNIEYQKFHSAQQNESNLKSLILEF
ncbi:MAG: hypothetical protein U0V72_07985 [Cytophagales bacterium]